MACLTTVERLIAYISNYLCAKPSALIPDMKQLCIALRQATEPYNIIVDTHLSDDNSTNKRLSDPRSQPEETEAESDEDPETKLKRRLEMYQRNKQHSLERHNAFKQRVSGTMLNCVNDLCFAIALFAYAPNYALSQNTRNALHHALCDLSHFAINESEMRSILDTVLCYVSTSLSFHDDHGGQLSFSTQRSIVRFDGASDDFVNVRSCETLSVCAATSMSTRVHCYVRGKGDEMWLGLVDVDRFGAAQSVEREQGVLLYYGGRQRLIGSDTSFGIWDNGQGAIHGAGVVRAKELSAYQHGHWISFALCGRRLEIHNNEEVVFVGEHGLDREGRGVFFMCTLDDEIDCVFVERANL